MVLPLIGEKDVEALTGKIIDIVIQKQIMKSGASILAKSVGEQIGKNTRKTVLSQAAATGAGILGAKLATNVVLPGLQALPGAVKGVSDFAFKNYYNSGMVEGGKEGVKMGIEQAMTLYMSKVKSLTIFPALVALWDFAGINPTTKLITRVGGTALVVYAGYQAYCTTSAMMASSVVENSILSHVRGQLITELDRLYSIGSIKSVKYDKFLEKLSSPQTLKVLSELKSEIFKYE
jgi:hypothetical protein